MTSPFPERIRAFVEQLENDFPTYNNVLNSFFDRIGFTEKFPPFYQKGPLLRVHAVKDNVWGMIEFDENIRRLIDSPLVQRLRGIRQNGLTHLTYPSATHTRFAHSLGVLAATTRLLDEIEKTAELDHDRETHSPLHAVDISKKTSQLLKRAAIIHDVGHGPYSHVSEKLFSSKRTGLFFATVPLNELLRRFRLEYFGIREANSPRPSGGKPLSEIISVLFICSQRFRDFYDHAVDSVSLNEQHDVFNISTLILGDRLYEDDLAAPAILSSAIDADKIDYMLRDATACGISLSIDPSRTFYGAGVYRLPVKDDPYLGEINLTNTDSVSVFVIDKSGSDTYFQIGVSRLSLYSRVYHHPLTRNAEFQFIDLLSKLQAKDDGLKDVLNVWKLSEGEIFHTAQQSDDDVIRQLAHSFIWRSFPKRAANLELGSITYCFASPFFSKFDSNFATLITEILYPIFEQADFVERISARVRKIGQLLGKQRESLRTSLNLRFVPSPSSEDAVIGNTRLIDRASQRLVKCEFHVPSYLQAGALAEKRSYVVVREDLREIAAVATAMEILQRGISRPPDRLVDSDDESLVTGLSTVSLNNEFLPHEIRFFPILDMIKVSNTCKISQAVVTSALTKLEDNTPADPIPRLLNRPRPSTQSMALATKFAQYEGAKGWKIDEVHLLNFMAQFPSKLREQVFALLSEFKIFDRQRICSDIQKAISKVAVNKKGGAAFIVPLTMNSGHIVLSYLRDSIAYPDSTWIVKDSIRAALAQAKPEDWIVFVDDHAASGTQVHRRLMQWMRGEAYTKTDSQLEPIYLDVFKKTKIAFAFAALAEGGANSIQKVTSDLSLETVSVAFGTPFDQFSLKQFTSDLPELRSFLRLVGTGLMLPRFKEGKRTFKRQVAEAREFALGYQNAEGGLVTELNVPTSTYTPFWRPGTYDPTGKYQRENHSAFPWMPLFIRSSHIDQVTLL